ncbi:MAG: nucleotidyltransferase family protein [Pseudomonadota bacterium]
MSAVWRPGAAMIFAAGFGRRMGALTRDCPKPLLKIAGRSLLDRVLDLLVDQKIPRAVINLHYRGAMIRRHLADRRDLRVEFSEEAPEILETGGGLRAALPLIGPGPLLTLNADALWIDTDPVATLLASWREEMEALLHLIPTGDAIAHPGSGDFFCNERGALSRRGDAKRAPFVYTGAQIIVPDRLVAQPPGAFSLNPVWDAMRADGGLYGVVGAGRWVDVGTPAGLAQARVLAEAGP